MTGLVLCRDCIYRGTSTKNTTMICRRRSPTVPVQQQSPSYDYVPATWPAISEDDGCGDGAPDA